MSTTVRLHVVLFMTTAMCLAQSATNAGKSPEVHSDRRVTFRLKAPKASAVKLWGDWITRFNTTEAMEKNEGGLWTITIGPLSPGKHSYIFIVDGLAVGDPNNASLAVGREGVEANLISVPGDGPLTDDERNVAHGAVHMHWYQSSLGLGQRRFLVYTPPDYAMASNTRYPVLVLLHGSGSTETTWINVGAANLIADNLIAEKRMRPMLIVMPNGWTSAPGEPDRDPSANADLIEQDLLRDVMPNVEAFYRVKRGSEHNAIAGASMGGFQALEYGLRKPERFGSIGIFSAGAHGPEGSERVGAAIAAGKLKHIRLFWIGIGDKDPLQKDAQALDAVLTRHKVEHQYVLTPDAGHTWLFWRRCLADFLPQLFANPWGQASKSRAN